MYILECSNKELSLSYVGKHLTLRGGVIWTRYSRGEDFFGFLLGDRFFDLKGGISFRLLYACPRMNLIPFSDEDTVRTV